jgi:hypothetical protein
VLQRTMVAGHDDLHTGEITGKDSQLKLQVFESFNAH